MERRHTNRAQVGGAMRARTHLLHLRKAGNFLQVCDAAGVHKLSVHNFGIQEYMRHTPETDRVFPALLRLGKWSDASRGGARTWRRVPCLRAPPQTWR